MKVLTSELEDEILSSGPAQYFFHKEEDGEVVVVFESTIGVVDPGEEDAVGRLWNPPIADAQGNPLLDFNGEPRQPWSKVEAKVILTCENRTPPMFNASCVYAFGGKKTSVLRNFVTVMRAEDINVEDLPGTKWSINRIGKWDWQIRYLGREGDSTPSPTKQTETKEVDLTEFKKALDEIKIKNPSVGEGIKKNDLIPTIAFITHKTSAIVTGVWTEMVKQGLITEKDGKAFIN